MRRSLLVAALIAVAAFARADGVRLTLGSGEGELRPLLGINIGPIPAGEKGNADLEMAYRAAGIRQIRTHDYYGPLDMATMYPDPTRDPADPAAYDFAKSDEVFRRIVDGGFEPYLRVGDSWNAAPGFPKAEPRKPADPRRWVEAAVHVVRHYTDETLWGARRLRCVEVWNEPDGRFWDGTRPEFCDLFVAAVSRLKKEFPDLLVGGPGWTPAGVKTPKGQAFVELLLARAEKARCPLDFLSWHMYSNDVADWAEAARFYREALDRHGYREAAQHVTEWHTDTHRGEGKQNALALRVGARGAAILTGAWIVLQQAGVTESQVYRGPDPARHAAEFYGIFHADGRPKKPALAFRLWSEVAAHPTRRPLEGTPGGLYALAASDSTGECVVLLANPTPDPVAWEIAGAPTGAVELAEVSDAREGIDRRPLGAPRGEIPGYAVQTVTLRPR